MICSYIFEWSFQSVCVYVMKLYDFNSLRDDVLPISVDYTSSLLKEHLSEIPN
jgi:hypothetical protein